MCVPTSPVEERRHVVRDSGMFQEVWHTSPVFTQPLLVAAVSKVVGGCSALWLKSKMACSQLVDTKKESLSIKTMCSRVSGPRNMC